MTTFNIVVDEVVREIMLEVCGTQEAHHGLGWKVGKHNLVFYADSGNIVGCKPNWVQIALEMVVRMFNRL